ncbi:MAG: efflux RND transporter periplasmic adaptor subunit [Gallionella sp.]|nr:efflux RND transporter periplasmic adaptor subunit [Gallionella sp.]
MTISTRPIALILSMTVLLAGCGGGNKPAAGPGGPGGPGAGMPPPEVDVITVTSGKATLTQDLPGRLQAYRTAQVRARVEGVIEKKLFKEGSDVKAGTPLFRIDARTYRSAAESAMTDLTVARQTVERYKSLLAIKAVSQQELDLANAKVKQAETTLIRAVEELENASVPASISGRIGRAMVTEGAFVGKGEATLLATIEQLDPIYANFTQSGADLLRLRQAVKAGKLQRTESAKVELLLEDGSVYPQAGNIFFTDMAVDPSTGAVSLRAEFPNAKRDLLPGMFVRIRFPEADAENAIRIPQRAVQAGPQGQFVMVVGAESKATPQPVKTGGMAGGDFIITEGLKGGEQVIVNGLQKARPGSVVVAKPITSRDTSPAAGSVQPNPAPADETPSHSTRPPQNSDQVASYPASGVVTPEAKQPAASSKP